MKAMSLYVEAIEWAQAILIRTHGICFFFFFCHGQYKIFYFKAQVED